MTWDQETYCERLVYLRAGEGDEEEFTILGRVIEEDEHFIVFETARRRYTISKRLVLFRCNTDIPFRREVER